MLIRNAGLQCSRQAGFSMVEMLVAAFILAIGILGLTLLQTMSLRATRGSQNLGIAVLLAEKVMDQVELEGRETYLNATITQYANPGALVGILYMKPATTSVPEYYKIDPTTGQSIPAATAADALFTVTMTKSAYAAGTGLSDVTVSVVFTDSVNATQTITRTATVTRRILHG